MIPKAIQDAPELDLGLEFTYSAFWELNTCREYGFSSGPIPWTAIKDYAIACDLEAEEIAEFTTLIRAMDNAMLKWNNDHKDDKGK